MLKRFVAHAVSSQGLFGTASSVFADYQVLRLQVDSQEREKGA